jgi:hypothetical protein
LARGAWDAVGGNRGDCRLSLAAAFGAYTRGGFATMVDYLSPVYWLFSRQRYRCSCCAGRFRCGAAVSRAGYPFVPLAFIGGSLYVLYSSLAIACRRDRRPWCCWSVSGAVAVLVMPKRESGFS